jgi:Ni,Fe-hydrogenase III small subunit
VLRILAQILRAGRPTEEPPVTESEELERLGIELRRVLDTRFAGSLSIRQVDAGSCNGCELEIHALNNPYHDVERFGVHFVASPRHADALLVTGPVARNMEAALRRTYDATPRPRLVIAAGQCACDGGEFGVSYASCGAVENVIPVDVKIPGCPPSPVRLLQGILGALRACAAQSPGAAGLPAGEPRKETVSEDAVDY